MKHQEPRLLILCKSSVAPIHSGPETWKCFRDIIGEWTHTALNVHTLVIIVEFGTGIDAPHVKCYSASWHKES